jgi:hypothetical protein
MFVGIMLLGTLKDGGGLGVSGPAGDHHGPGLLRHGLHHLCLQPGKSAVTLQQTGLQAALSFQPGKSAVNFATNWTSSCSANCKQASQWFIRNKFWL